MLEQLLEKPGSLITREVPRPSLEPGDVLLKVEALTLCGSDVRVYTGEKTGGVRWPMVIGHEFSGRVVEVADDTIGAGLLDASCAVMPWISCGRCRACRRGETNLCPQVKIFGYDLPGGMAEYVRIPQQAVLNGNLTPLPADVRPEYGALAEPLSCVYHGHRRSRIGVGSTVLVLGAGPIGIFHARLASAAGARTVIVSEPDAARQSYVANIPRTKVVDPGSADVLESVRSATDGEGVDASIVCVGLPELVGTAVDCTRAGGLVNLFAGFGRQGISAVDLNAIHYRQLDVIGGVDATFEEFETAVSLLATGGVDAASMITHRFGLNEAREALEAARSAEGIKVAIVP